MKKYIAITVLFLFIGLALRAQAIEEYFDKGSELYIHGKNVEAKSAVMAGLTKYPGNVELTQLRKLLEEEDENEDKKDQDKKDQDQKDKEDEQEKQDQDKKDQEDQEKDQDQQDKDQQKEQEQDQQPEPNPNEMSKENAEQILEALQQDEREVKEKVDEQKKINVRTKRVDKEW